jgi:shikimate kinase/3-dehydroquinate synthase
VTCSHPIFLTGFMATGKSRIGRVLALQLDRPFYDTDEMVEMRAGKPIPRIFSEDGEDVFRQLEAECVVDAAARPDAVVALGGGAIASSENRATVRASGGLLICVQADVETILERVSRRDERPLLAGLSKEQKREKIESMLKEREPHYAMADITLQSTETSDAEELARRLADRLGVQ